MSSDSGEDRTIITRLSAAERWKGIVCDFVREILESFNHEGPHGKGFALIAFLQEISGLCYGLILYFSRSDFERNVAPKAYPPSGRSAKQRIIIPLRGLKNENV